MANLPITFKALNAKGEPLTCKFCHAKVWWNTLEGRWYDVEGETLHVENCELRKQHYKDRAYRNSQTRRDK